MRVPSEVVTVSGPNPRKYAYSSCYRSAASYITVSVRFQTTAYYSVTGILNEQQCKYPCSTLVTISRRMKKPIAVDTICDGRDPLLPKLGQKLGKTVRSRILFGLYKAQLCF